MQECLSKMYNQIKLILKYDGSTQGDIDRDAFKAICDAEVATALVYPDVIISDIKTLHSYSILDADTLQTELYYDESNLGLSNRNNFYDAAITEKAKSTVLVASITKYNFFVEPFDRQITDFENKGLLI